MKQLTLMLSVLFLFSCGKENDCVTCTNETFPNSDTEICEDVSFSYVDEQGNILTYSEYVKYYEDLGFECK